MPDVTGQYRYVTVPTGEVGDDHFDRSVSVGVADNCDGYEYGDKGEGESVDDNEDNRLVLASTVEEYDRARLDWIVHSVPDVAIKT